MDGWTDILKATVHIWKRVTPVCSVCQVKKWNSFKKVWTRQWPWQGSIRCQFQCSINFPINGFSPHKYTKFHSQSPATTYWSVKHLMITSCPKRMTIMIGYERVVSPVAIFPSMIKTHHRPLHIMQWYDISFCTAHIGSTRLFQRAKNLQRATDVESLPTAYFQQDVTPLWRKKFMHKFPGSCNGSDEPTGWPPRCPDTTPPNFSRGVTWRTPSSLLSLYSSFHKTRNTGWNFLPNNLSIIKSEHMKLDTFHLKLAYTYVHTHTYTANEKTFKVKTMDTFKLLKMTKS